VAGGAGNASGIIPGDWGKVESGWLGLTPLNAVLTNGQWRQDSPVPLQRSRAASNAKFRNWAKRIAKTGPIRVK